MEKPLNILLLEDSEFDAELILRELKKGPAFISRVTETREDFENALRDFQPDAILSDHSLPSFDSLQALEIVRNSNQRIPFILVTGSVSEEFAAQSIKNGADDYILKGKLTRLNMSIANAINKRISERERQLAVEKIYETNKELNTYIYKATHDLRGPICTIMGLTDLAVKGGDGDKLDYLRMISESSHKLDAILISLIESMSIKNAVLNVQEVNIRQLIDQVLQKLHYVVGYENVRFVVDVQDDFHMMTDESILVPTVRNLIDNAIRYRDNLNADPFVSIVVRSDSNGTTIEISDNGVGISPEMHEKVFEMFYKGNLQSTGSGLGLYVAKNGVEKLGGTIRIMNNKDRGSVFIIELPLSPKDGTDQ